MAGFPDAQTMSDCLLLENTASRLLRVRDDLESLQRDDLAVAADTLMELVSLDAGRLRERMREVNEAFSEAD